MAIANKSDGLKNEIIRSYVENVDIPALKIVVFSIL